MAPKRSKKTILECSKNLTIGAQTATFKVQFVVDSTFRVPGAITVVNRYEKELFLESVIIEGVVRFSCNSWVQPGNIIAHKRIFFSDKANFPFHTVNSVFLMRQTSRYFDSNLQACIAFRTQDWFASSDETYHFSYIVLQAILFIFFSSFFEN